MKRTVYSDYWVIVLKEVVNNPMQRGINYAKALGISHGRASHVLSKLKKEGYIGSYEYEFTNVYECMHRYYYPLEKGIAVVKMIYADKN